MTTLNIILNGNIVKGHKGESILDLARRLNIEIPTLCHDPRLEPFSSCYLCVVEVEGMRGLQPACSTKITEGMRIETENERVKKSRKFALELMLSNHYANCVAPCKESCPAGVDVQGYIALINQGKYSEATGLIKNTNPLPAICGRVCVRPCELACRRNLVEGEGVGIDYLKRYTTDKDFESDQPFKPKVKDSTGKKVAVIGAGPGGLTASYFLACDGHSVEIFEASSHPGGMLRYGIPPYRLPNEVIDAEVKSITDLGVKIHYRSKLGDNVSFQSLQKDFDAVILAIGSQSGSGIGCENDDANNIFSGIDFLRNMEMTGQKYDFKGKKVGVIGGGNTAMDCCRTAIRCGSTDVTVLYRRTEKEMPANPIEIHESKLEGVKYSFLTAPAKVNKDKHGNLESLSCFKMELGEPDASGRRRPVKIDGSEFDMKFDYILAAIGQKTHVNFLEDINKNASQHLKINKWGDIDTHPKTLQTSIESVFACGDGVTGPATLIEGIAQGRVAAQSCDKFLRGLEVRPSEFEFISRKDHFQLQSKEDYENAFLKQEREEMPTLNPKHRLNFNEVELGYSDKQAHAETHRCLECGCTEYYSCDLKKYATQYRAEQKRFGGDYQKFEVDFSHPHIEIDNNKCILCGRCVRICKEVVGANALGFVNRGFETYIAPSMGQKLQDTHCESCGMCISTCPTGALTENVPFKPGPLPSKTFTSICNFCSVGCTVEYHHHNGFFTHVDGASGLINKMGSLCKMPRFGYHYLNRKDRITHALLKKDGSFQPISFEEALSLMLKKIQNVEPNANAFFAGARLSNEEQYLIQKIARAGALTHNISSFHYMNRGEGCARNSEFSIPFDQLQDCTRMVLLGSEINRENPVAGFMLFNAAQKNGSYLDVISTLKKSNMAHKAHSVNYIKSYYFFVKALNYFILKSGLQNDIFIKNHCLGFEEYKESLLKENYQSLISESGASKDFIENFARAYNDEHKVVIVFAEKNVSDATAFELQNLALITGKKGKPAAGLLCLKEKNNSQGLFDMGVFPDRLPAGGFAVESDHLQILKEVWEVEKIAHKPEIEAQDFLKKEQLQNVFIFGEDPIGTAQNKESIMKMLSSADFVMVQDYFMTETAQLADLILPASSPFEIGGSFTNTQRNIQHTEASLQSILDVDSFEQLNQLLSRLSSSTPYESPTDVMMEIALLLQKMPNKEQTFTLESTKEEGLGVHFKNACDSLHAGINTSD